MGHACSAEIADHLIELRADVDFQFDVRCDLSRPGRMIFALVEMKHRFGQQTQFSNVLYVLLPQPWQHPLDAVSYTHLTLPTKLEV